MLPRTKEAIGNWKCSYYSCINYCYYGGTIAVCQFPSSCYYGNLSLQGVCVPLWPLSSANLWAVDKHPLPGESEMGPKASDFQVDKHSFGEKGGFPIPVVESLELSDRNHPRQHLSPRSLLSPWYPALVGLCAWTQGQGVHCFSYWACVTVSRPLLISRQNLHPWDSAHWPWWEKNTVFNCSAAAPVLLESSLIVRPAGEIEAVNHSLHL